MTVIKEKLPNDILFNINNIISLVYYHQGVPGIPGFSGPPGLPVSKNETDLTISLLLQSLVHNYPQFNVLTLVSTSALSLSIGLEIKILASAILTHCNDSRTHCNLSSLVKHCSNINSSSASVRQYECTKTKLLSILCFFFQGEPGAVGPPGLPGVPGCNGTKVQTKLSVLDCIWLCLGMAKNCSKFPPTYNFDLFCIVTLSARKLVSWDQRKEKCYLFVQNKYINNTF